VSENKLRAAPIFSDGMVLQYGKPAPVWGWGKENAGVSLVWKSGADQLIAQTRVFQGKWRVNLPPLPAGQRGTLIISDGETEIRFQDVLTGDVWFAGGQSNMEMELPNCLNGKAELERCAQPDIRFYQVVKRAVVDGQYLREEAQTRWRSCSPENAHVLSAVAYFFARKIHSDMGIPIGIINCSWGGTSISAWMSEEQLMRSMAGKRYIDDYAALMGAKTDAQYDAEMEAYCAEWRAWDDRVRAWRKKEPDASWETLNKECGGCPWPQPAGGNSPYRPTRLYRARIRRVAPYGIKGFLYYQGEEDAPRARDYAEMMYYLIDQWRGDWEDERLPFLFVQLPMYASREEMEAGQPDKSWCLLRENQYRAAQSIANTGMAVVIDCGEYDNIHPLDKQTVGLRLANLALRKIYGKAVEAEGPVFSWTEPEGKTLRVHFDRAESGLDSRGELLGFEVAGEDGVYYPAAARIDGNCVVLQSERVGEPRSARYAWVNFGPTPLYGKNGLPVMPFRSRRDSDLKGE
jgi:sialate O-acetylesterase